MNKQETKAKYEIGDRVQIEINPMNDISFGCPDSRITTTGHIIHIKDGYIKEVGIFWKTMEYVPAIYDIEHAHTIYDVNNNNYEYTSNYIKTVKEKDIIKKL